MFRSRIYVFNHLGNAIFTLTYCNTIAVFTQPGDGAVYGALADAVFSGKQGDNIGSFLPILTHPDVIIIHVDKFDICKLYPVCDKQIKWLTK